jgi:DNA invertase Pin-like site-specific DNA recombinase
MVQIKPKRWGYILQGPGRPPLAKQRDALRELGVDIDPKFGHDPVWHDKLDRVVGGKSAGDRQLEDRKALAKAARAGDTVVVAAPYCLGLSERDARSFIETLSAHGATLIVGNDGGTFPPGADVTELIAALVRQQNTTNVAAYRRQKSRK